MKFFLSVLVSLLIFSTASYVYANECYTKSEAEAEQGIRIHSELMVIGLNCAHMASANGSNLYMEHKKFTAKHADLFAEYENTLMDYMRNNNVKNPEKAMHKLRTEFANKISSEVAKMRPDIFCRTFSSRIEKAAGMSRENLRKWAATPFPGHEVSKPLCDEI